MDCIDLLIADHNRARGLFKRFKAADKADDVGAMTEAASKICSELSVHMQMEEDIFYRAVRGDSDEITDTVYEGCEEHHVGKVLVGELGSMSPGTEAWKAKVGVLIEITEHHLDEEESDMFPKVRTATTAEQRERLGQRMHRCRVELGGPSMDKALDLTKAELDELAKTQEIPGRSKMDKEELAATVDPRG